MQFLDTGENGGWSRACGTEKGLPNRSIQFVFVSLSLGLFECGKEPAKEVGGIGIFGVEHDGYGLVVIADEDRFENGGAEIVDGAVRMNAADDGGEESFGIGSAFHDGASERSGEQRWDLIGDAGGFSQDLPDGWEFGIGEATAGLLGKLTDDLQTLMMVV